MATPESPGSAGAARKVSRYRSVRRQQEQHHQQSTDNHEIPPVPTMPKVPVDPQKEAAMSRSMSRYHRRPSTSHARPKVPTRSNTDVPPLPSPKASNDALAAARSRALSSPANQNQTTIRKVSNEQPRVPNTSRTRAEPAPLVAKGAREPPQSARDEAKQLMQGEAERQRRMQEKIKAEKRAKLEAAQAEQDRLKREEAERIRAQQEAEEAERIQRQREEARMQLEQEERDQRRKLQKAESAARLKARQEAEQKAKVEEAEWKAQMARSPPSSPPTSPPKHGRGFGFLKSRKEEPPGSPEGNSNGNRSRQTSNNQDMATIRPGGGGAVLGIDAPISAVNAGDRRVMVECGKSQIMLPVTPTTTPQDLIRSASNCLTEQISVKGSVLLESFYKVGVQRPLRNYEHVRDVMNSWDDDKQNSLIIVDAIPSGIDQDELLASRVPESKPQGMGCYIHYSQKPGKWSKRFFTLREDGQVVSGKSEGSKDVENVCHLSDFDVYTPTQRKLQKSVKPPKKICYAVKSQQKSTMFMDESRFVHFFCTNDKATANLFYRSLQGWRSWYLKHVMGEGQKKSKAAEPAANTGYASTAVRNISGPNGSAKALHRRSASVDSHYQLGSFKPLLDIDFSTFGKEAPPKKETSAMSYPDDAPLAKFDKLDTKAMHARKMSMRTKGHPPLSYNMGTHSRENVTPPSGGLVSQAQSTSQPEAEDPFTSGGLLGRQYSQRQRKAQERDEKNLKPFTEGPNLLNNINTAYVAQATAEGSGLNRRSSVRSSHRRASSDVQRNSSVRMKQKPLVDLTPQYKEPPQHARKGKGFNPEDGAGPLIDNATSPEEAIKVPSSTNWRRPTTSAGPQTHGTYGTDRTKSLRGSHQRTEGLAAYTVNNHTGAPEDHSNAFTPGGLLARTGFSQGHTQVGHGVMDGSKARGRPMLDMSEDSRFAPGSLLADVERTHGQNAPVIDRERD